MPTRSAPRGSKAPRTRIDATTGIAETVFENGLKLLTCERHEVPIVTVMTWYRIGSGYESEGHTGLAHFLEHMMFKGTDRYAKGEIDRLTQILGGSNNAMTSRDFTSYYFNVPAGTWEEILAIEANRMTKCLFDPEELKLEQSVVLEEIKRSDDSPYGILDKHMFATAFTSHPYRHPILGWQRDMERVTREDVRDFYRRHYHPGNAFLVMVGDFDTADAVAKVGRHFGRLPAGPARLPVREAEPEATGERRVAIRQHVKVPRIQLLYRTIPGSHPDDSALDVVSSLLSDGKSSVLHDRLVETRRLMTEVDTINDTKADGGVFFVVGKMMPGIDPERGLAEIDDVFEQLARKGPTRRSLEQAKNQSEADYHFMWERIFHQAYMIGKSELYGDFRRIGRYVDDVRAVSAEDVRRVVATYLNPDNRTVGLLLPKLEGVAS